MFRDILTSRAIHAGAVFFLLVVGSSLLYHWHVRRTQQEELERTQQAMALENKTLRHPVQNGGVSIDTETLDATQGPVENENTQSIDRDTDTFDMFDELLYSEILDETEDNTILSENAEETEDNGYPEVPAGFPFSLVWEASEEHLAQVPSVIFEELELMGLVMIKLWNEGDQGFSGAFMSDGKVYPTYSDVAYVKWDKSNESGDWSINEVTTVDSSVSEQLLNGIFPPGIEIVDQDSAGINPHAFLSQ